MGGFREEEEDGEKPRFSENAKWKMEIDDDSSGMMSGSLTAGQKIRSRPNPNPQDQTHL